MFAEERYLRIMQIVKQNGKATVAELSEQLGVSAVTIRRDLEKLEEREQLIRTHGGAMPAEISGEQAHERSFAEKEEAFAAEKERIAAAAAALVRDGEAILLTPGTTNMLLAGKLADKKELTIVTNAANIIGKIGERTDVDVILLGGKLRRKSFALVGPLAEEALRNIRVDKLFLGVDGFDLQEGLTTPNMSEAYVNRQMISIAGEVIVACDHSKFNKTFFAHIAAADVVQTVITDDGISESMARKIRDAGIKLITV